MDRTLERAAGALNELFDSDPCDPVSFAETAGAVNEIVNGKTSARITGRSGRTGIRASTLGTYRQNGA